MAKKKKTVKKVKRLGKKTGKKTKKKPSKKGRPKPKVKKQHAKGKSQKREKPKTKKLKPRVTKKPSILERTEDLLEIAGDMEKDAGYRKKLFYFLRELDSELHMRIKRIVPHEQTQALEYSIISQLKEKHLDLERRFMHKKAQLKKSHSGIDYIEHKISQLPAKITLFALDFDKGEFKKICRLIQTLEKEVSHV